MRANDAQKDTAFQELQRILQDAAEGGADSVELEWVAEGLEVTCLFGSTGIGDVLSDRELASEVIGLIIDRAQLEDKTRGVMRWMLLGKHYDIIVEEYENFGESAFKLKFGKPRRKRP